MKQISIFMNIVLVCILTLMIMPASSVRASTPTPTPAAEITSAPVCDTTRTVQVSGTAVINVVPDRALIQLGVQSNGKTPAEAEDINTAAMQKIIKALNALKIESKDIATDWYYVTPVYKDYAPTSITGYQINNTIAVTVRDIKQVSKVVSSSLKAGANQVINVELYTSELRKYRDQARELAVKATQEKASLLANAAGAQTNCVISISENVSSYYNGWWYGSNNSALWTQNVSQNVAPSAGNAGGESALSETGPVSLGQISVRAEVTTIFGLK